VKIRRYWAPPTDGRIRYSKPEEYVENFQSLLEAAVADRLRTDRVGILLSGGLDSSSVAAVAKEMSGKSSQASELRGYTYIYESLIPDCESDYAREVGESLRVPIRFLSMDQVQLFAGWDDPERNAPSLWTIHYSPVFLNPSASFLLIAVFYCLGKAAIT